MEPQTCCFTCKCNIHEEITTFSLPEQHMIRLWEEGSCRSPCVWFWGQMAKQWTKAVGYSIRSGKFVSARAFESQGQHSSSSGITHFPTHTVGSLHTRYSCYHFPQIMNHLRAFIRHLFTTFLQFPLSISQPKGKMWESVSTLTVTTSHFNCSRTPGVKILLPRWCVENKLWELPNSLHGRGRTNLSVLAKVVMTFTPASQLDPPSTSGKWSGRLVSVLTGFMWTTLIWNLRQNTTQLPRPLACLLIPADGWNGQSGFHGVSSVWSPCAQSLERHEVKIRGQLCWYKPVEAAKEWKPVYRLQMLMSAVVGLCFQRNHQLHSQTTKPKQECFLFFQNNKKNPGGTSPSYYFCIRSLIKQYLLFI